MYLHSMSLLLALTGTDTTVAVGPRGKLELRNHEGPVTITVWNRQAVRVKAEHDDETRVEVETSGGVLRVSSRSRYGPETVSYDISVPADMALEIFAQEGDVRVSGSRAEVEVESVEGAITLEGGRGRVQVSSVDGDLTIRDASGRIGLSTVDGDLLAVGLEGDIEATTVDGDIALEGVKATNVEATTVDGDISMTGEVRGDGRYHLSSHDGDVTLTAPSLDATITISTFEGEFTSDFPVTVNATGRKLTFTLGAGRARVELESFDGEVALLRGGAR
jgi:DUF4097 and DUF4098 domain-containing protein YvlB